MDKKYKVLKKFGDLKKGEEFDPSQGYDGTEDDILEAVEAGYISEIVADEEGEAPVSKKKAAAKTSVTVTTNAGERVYSLEVHGEDFEALAKSFADQHPEATIA